MPWVVAAAVVGAGATLYSSNQSQKSQDKQTAIAEQQAQIGSDQYGTYQSLYAPREKELLNSVFDQSKTPAAEAARAGAEASSAADNAEQITLRNARRSGVNINSPAYASLTRDNQANRAGLISAAKTYGRRYADETNFNRQSSALDRGRNLVSNATSANSSASNMYGELASAQSSNDSARGALYGQTAGYIGSALKGYLNNGNSNSQYLSENNPNSLDY